MEPEIPMILPKGIVVNTKEIYDEIAKHPSVPADRVWEIWRVYTTTNKKLQDPTARRLENFWWHVLGSDRLFLSGKTLATLYEDISLGPTFVPLRGPPNRWEGDDVLPFIRQALSILEAEKNREQPQSETALNGSGVQGLRDLSSSAAKPPPPHPILKKPRGPSSSGPRPTARFVSPETSGDEDEKDNETPSSVSTVTPALGIRLPVTSPTKKKLPGKKFVASIGAAKRRPMLPRKSSSQSSATSDNGSKEGTSSSSSRGSATPQRPVSPIVEGPHPGTPVKLEASPKLSANAAGKRPALASRTTAETKDAVGNNIDPAVQHESSSDSQPHVGKKAMHPAPLVAKQKLESLTRRPQSLINLSRHAQTTTTSSQSGNSDSDSAPSTRPGIRSVPMAQSRSHSGYVYRRECGTSRGLDQGLFTGATASTTNIAAQGVIIDQSGSFSHLPSSSFFDHRSTESGSGTESLSSSLLESRFTPTQPSTAPAVPLGRTKSQLTLLLERENEARAGNKSRSKS